MAQEHVKRAIDKQELALEDLELKRPEQASKDQIEAAEELQKALQPDRKSTRLNSSHRT